MNQSLPLHPAIVHLPLALAILMPLLSASVTWLWWRNWLPGRRIWSAVFLAQLLLGISAYVAVRTGENEEELVERVVAEHALEAHEEAAESFLIAGLTVAILAFLPLVLPKEGQRKAMALATILSTLVVAALAIRTGEAGGELVYQHGAASAYASGAAATSSLSEGASSDREVDD